jgi:hypothetical protein
MPAFFFTCPQTGRLAHGWTAEETPAFDRKEVVECPACMGLHTVDTRSGKVSKSASTVPTGRS